MKPKSVADVFEAVADRLSAGTVGPYAVEIVDEQQVRDSSPELEEFSNYAIPSDFPDQIPEQTIWLSAEVPQDERWILIEEAIARIEAEAKGLDPAEAYDAGLHRSKQLRGRSHPKESKPSDDSVKLKKLATAGGLTVWLVDGEKIRDSVDIDFVEGGHDLVYGFIPENEIWIDKEVPASERQVIVAHEADERKLMSGGMPYEEAHKHASRFEWNLR